MEFRHSFICASRCIYKFLVTFFEFLDFTRRVCVSLGNAYARNTAFNRGVDRSVAFSSVVESFFHRFAVMCRNDYHYRHTGEDYKRQYWVYAEKVCKGKNDHNRADKEVFGAVVSKLANLEKVACYSCHYAPGFVVIVEPEGKLL